MAIFKFYCENGADHLPLFTVELKDKEEIKHFIELIKLGAQNKEYTKPGMSIEYKDTSITINRHNNWQVNIEDLI